MLRYYPNYFYNSLTPIDTSSKKVIRLSVETDSHTFVTLYQKDARLFDESYIYSYFRVSIARVSDSNIEYVSLKCECKRNIVFEKFLTAGEYIILIEPIWYIPNPVGFTISTYSSSFVFLSEMQDVATSQFNRMELLIWKSYCESNPTKLVEKYNSKIVEADFSM